MMILKVGLEGGALNQGAYMPDEKLTYGNVKKWSKEKYSFNVTNLYVGQIKGNVDSGKEKSIYLSG